MKKSSIINLSSRELSVAEKKVLEFGLSFCPTIEFDYPDNRIDLYKFTRKLRLHKWFSTKPPVTKPKTIGKELSNLDIGSMDLLFTLGQLEGSVSEDADAILNLANVGIDLSHSCPSGFSKKSTFTPPSRNDAFEIFEDLVIKDPKKRSYKKEGGLYNLTMEQRKALEALADDRSIIIK